VPSISITENEQHHPNGKKLLTFYDFLPEGLIIFAS